MNIFTTIIKLSWRSIAWVLSALVSFLDLLLSQSTDEETDPFKVDYPDYTPSADKPGNIAMHDILHHD